MSKFKTVMMVDVEAIKRELPNNVFIHGVEFQADPPRVELTWEHDGLKTPYTFPLDYPLELLQARQVPKGVTVIEAPRGTAGEKPVEPEAEKADTVTQTNESVGEPVTAVEQPEKPGGKRGKRAAGTAG